MACVASFVPLNTEDLTKHEFFVKKFERTLLRAVESNRLRRFGRLHEFFWKLFLLSVRCPNHFFCQNPTGSGTPLLACSIDAADFIRIVRPPLLHGP